MPRQAAPRFGRKLVELACPSCHIPVAIVTENRDGLWITLWAPAPWETRGTAARVRGAGGKGRLPDYGYLLTRPLPPAGNQPVPLHCVRDGAVDFPAEPLRDAVLRYRKCGTPVRVSGRAPAPPAG